MLRTFGGVEMFRKWRKASKRTLTRIAENLLSICLPVVVYGCRLWFLMVFLILYLIVFDGQCLLALINGESFYEGDEETSEVVYGVYSCSYLWGKSGSRFVRFEMRPYRRKHHSSWRTRRSKGIVKQVAEYLKPFVRSTTAVWRLEPPFPLTAKICVTVITWFLLFLPLCYFLVPPLAALFLLNYFSDRFDLESWTTRMGEFCARARWTKRIFLPLRFFDRLAVAFFLYDYYQIIKCLRSE